MLNLHSADKLLTPCNSVKQTAGSRGLAGSLYCKQSAIPNKGDTGAVRQSFTLSARSIEDPAAVKKGILDHAIDLTLVFSSVAAITEIFL